MDAKTPGSVASGPSHHGHGEDRVLTQVRPEVVDDFIRNFLIKVGMTRTLDNFNSEWYELQAKGKLAEEYTSTVPDIYLRNQELDEKVVGLQRQLDKMRDDVAKNEPNGTADRGFRSAADCRHNQSFNLQDDGQGALEPEAHSM